MARVTPVAVVENASLPAARRLRTCLGQLATAAAEWRLSGPAVILLGEIFKKDAAVGSAADAGLLAYGNSRSI